MKLKSIMMAVAIAATAVSLPSCGSSSDNNYESSSTSSNNSVDDLSSFVGTWECSYSIGDYNRGDQGIECITLRIKSNGTGSIHIWDAVGFDQNKTIIRDNVTISRDGNILYLALSDGNMFKLQIKGDRLYTADGSGSFKRQSWSTN